MFYQFEEILSNPFINRMHSLILNTKNCWFSFIIFYDESYLLTNICTYIMVFSFCFFLLQHWGRASAPCA